MGEAVAATSGSTCEATQDSVRISLSNAQAVGCSNHEVATAALDGCGSGNWASFSSWYGENAFRALNSVETDGSQRSWLSGSGISPEDLDRATLRSDMQQEKEEEFGSRRWLGFRRKDGFQPKDLDLQWLARQRYGHQANFHHISSTSQCELIRGALSTRDWTINPKCSYMKFWDLVILLCLAFTAIVTPFEIAFLKASMFVKFINQLVGGLFIKDFLLQFFLQSQKQTTKGMVWRRNWKETSKAYLRSWFLIDLLAVLPYEKILKSQHTDRFPQKTKLVQTLRLLRLAKLLQVLRFTRVVQRVQTRISLKFVTVYFIRFHVLITIACHWMACAWCFVGTLEDSFLFCKDESAGGDAWPASFPLREYVFRDTSMLDPYNPEAWAGQSWVARFALDRAASTPIDPCSPFTTYIVSIYWAIQTMTSVGYGDVLPYTVAEYGLCSVCMMLSSLLWAYIISLGCAVMMKKDTVQSLFEHRIDAFNAMCDKNDVPLSGRYRGREYIRETCYHHRYLKNLESLKFCTHDLRSRIALVTSAQYFDSIWMFEKISYQCKADLACKFIPHFYGKREVVQHFGKLCIVDRGAVGRLGRVIVPWGGWGEDMILRDDQLHRKTPCSTLIYTEIVTLSREDTSLVLLSYPHDFIWFRRFALRIALLRVASIYRHELAMNERKPQFHWIHVLMKEAQKIDRGDRHCSKRFRASQERCPPDTTRLSLLGSLGGRRSSTRMGTEQATLLQKLHSMGERLEKLEQRVKHQQLDFRDEPFPCSI